MKIFSPVEWLIFGFGVICALAAGHVWQIWSEYQATQNYYTSSEVHVHSDFAIYIFNERIDLSDDRFMSSTEQIMHPDLHLHDGNPNILHRHAADLTFVEFIDSLGFTLTNECFTTEDRIEYCSDETNTLTLYVNDAVVTDIEGYINQDEDRILLHYGTPEENTITTLFETVTDEACIYSYTCSWRGVPPPESCGLTCEI